MERSEMRRCAAAVLIAGLAMPALAYRVSAWIPTWDPAALESMQRHAGNLDEANPSWYALAADGSIAANWNAEAPELRAALAGTRLAPTIKNYIAGSFDSEVMSAILASAESRERHAEAIAQLAVTKVYDGIDIDYEAMRAADRERFSLFVETLAAKLQGLGKTLSVTVHAKTSDAAWWDGPGAQDWGRIGAAADTMKVMAYDKHWAGSEPGAIAPLDWVASVARYATRVVAPEKVIIALPWYGYDWGSAGGKSVTWAEATELARAAGASIGRDENGEATFRYRGQVVYFQDRASYTRKIDYLLARVPALGGFAHWRVGGEDPAVWDEIAQLRGTGGSAVGRPRGTCAIDAPAAIAVRAGAEASAPIAIVPVDGFDGTVNASVATIDRFDGSVALTAAALRVGAPATLFVSAAASASPGTYRLRLTLEAPTGKIEQEIRVEIARPRGRTARR